MSAAAPDEKASAPSLRVRAREWLGAPLAGDLEAAFAAEMAESNRKRLAVLLPLMVVVHAIHIAVFRVSAAERPALTPLVVRWREAVVEAHAVTLAFAVVLAVLAFRPGKSPAARFVGPATGIVYLLHGAAAVSADQLTITGATPFVGYCLGAAVVLSLRPLVAVLLYGIAVTAFVVGIVTVQPSASARLATLPNGFSIAAISVALAWMLYASRRRDFLQRITIGQQREALAQLNLGLERRVSEQVSEIVKRAEEVERLNTQLRAQVRTRSNELSKALSRLSDRDGSPDRLERGSLLGGRFEIEGLIGQGGMGVVYSGLDRVTGTAVAIKVIQASSSEHLSALHRFLREAEAAATVTHPAIVRMLHVDVSEDGMLFQVQELVQGEALHLRLRQGRRWEPSVAARIGAVLSEALAAAHASGIVHRDVKPANVMLTMEAPGLKLLDFGIAKLYEEAQGGENATRTGSILGTPRYMGPEHMDGSRHVTDRADVYSVGVMLFLLSTGRYPFDSVSTRRQSGGVWRPSDPRSLEPSVPKELSELVVRCLEDEPSSRPSATELGKALSDFADHHGAGNLERLECDGALQDVDAAATIQRRAPASIRPSAPPTTPTTSESG